jgi:hypothetical protein
MSAFGPIVLPSMVEAKIKTIFKAWMPTYLLEMQRVSRAADGEQMDLAEVRSWELMSSLDERFPEQQLPGVVLTWETMSFVEHAESMLAEVPMAAEIMVQSTSYDSARKRAGLYAMALALMAMHKLDRDPMIEEVSVPTIGLPVLAETEQRRWRAIGSASFTVFVPHALAPGSGPVDFAPIPTSPPPDYPTALTVQTTVDE